MFAVVAVEGAPMGLGGARGQFGPGALPPEPPGDERAEPSPGLLLHYHVPEYLEGHIEQGHLVVVPLRGKPTHGVVVEVTRARP